MTIRDLSLRQVIMCAVNTVEVSSKYKKEVVEEVVRYVENHYVSRAKIEEVFPSYYTNKL